MALGLLLEGEDGSAFLTEQKGVTSVEVTLLYSLYVCETLFLALKKRIHSELVWGHNVHEQGGESCTLWQRGASKFVFFTRCYWGEQIKWNEVGWAGQVVRMIGKKCVQRNILIWKLEGNRLEHRCYNIEVAINGIQFEDVDWVHLISWLAEQLLVSQGLCPQSYIIRNHICGTACWWCKSPEEYQAW